MATERDLSGLLPPSPPPRPDRREAAIAAAMRRFDGDAPPTRIPAPSRRWRLAGRPQLGALAVAALVAVIGLPLWLASEPQRPVAARDSVPVTSAAVGEGVSQADVATEPLPDALVSRAPGIVAAPEPSAAVPAQPAEQRLRDTNAVPAPTLSLPSLAAAPPSPPPPPPAPAMAAAEEAGIANDIVVTGSRVSGRAAKAQQQLERRLTARGDWNACTVDDPRRDLSSCREAVPAGASGTTGRAAANVGEGLTRAWQDDLDGAVAAFDRAIALSPKDAAARLNRGLARAKAGDDSGALADFDKAVRYAPSDPRGWFQRSRVLRRQGKIARADADAARAAELDPRYEAVID